MFPAIFASPTNVRHEGGLTFEVTGRRSPQGEGYLQAQLAGGPVARGVRRIAHWMFLAFSGMPYKTFSGSLSRPSNLKHPAMVFEGTSSNATNEVVAPSNTHIAHEFSSSF